MNLFAHLRGGNCGRGQKVVRKSDYNHCMNFPRHSCSEFHGKKAHAWLDNGTNTQSGMELEKFLMSWLSTNNARGRNRMKSSQEAEQNGPPCAKLESESRWEAERAAVRGEKMGVGTDLGSRKLEPGARGAYMRIPDKSMFWTHIIYIGVSSCRIPPRGPQ